MELLVPDVPVKRYETTASPVLSRDFRRFLAGSMAQSIFAFAKRLSEVDFTPECQDVRVFLMDDALQLYDSLLILSLQPQTVTFDRAEIIQKKGGLFTNIWLRFLDSPEAKLSLSLGEEKNRHKIQADLIKKMSRRSGHMNEVPFLSIAAVSYRQMPVEFEIVLGRSLAGQRFFPIEAEERIEKESFVEHFEELVELSAQVLLSR